MIKIGNINLNNPLILAPMAGFSNPALRRLVAEIGAGLTVTEMISVKGLLYGNEKTNDLLKTDHAERVVSVQLFGREPDDFAQAVRFPQLERFDFIDINMGCPVKKIAGAGEGSALMGDFKRAAEIVRAAKSTGKTVTVKTRLLESNGDNTGCYTCGSAVINANDDGSNIGNDVGDVSANFICNCADGNGNNLGKHSCKNYGKTDPAAFAKNLQDAGADMIVIHARTPAQMYRGTADYDAFSYIKARLSVPVGLSGDIVDLPSFLRAKESGADLFMIGRGAVANPLVFADILTNYYNKNESITKDIRGNRAEILSDSNKTESNSANHIKNTENKKSIILRLLDYMTEDMGEFTAVRAFRKFLPYVLKGERCNKEQKHGMNFIEDMETLKATLCTVL